LLLKKLNIKYLETDKGHHNLGLHLDTSITTHHGMASFYISKMSKRMRGYIVTLVLQSVRDKRFYPNMRTSETIGFYPTWAVLTTD
jgi:hypothetical protein